jgi:hypothetical protein
MKKLEKPLPEDIKKVFDIPPEPQGKSLACRDLTDDWFKQLEKYNTSFDEIDAWVAEIERRTTNSIRIALDESTDSSRLP